MRGCGDGVANTRSDDDMWWVSRRFSSKVSSLTAASKEGVGDRLSRKALVGSKSSRKTIMKCINLRQSRYLTKITMSLEHIRWRIYSKELFPHSRSLRIKIRNKLTCCLAHLIKFWFNVELHAWIISAIIAIGYKFPSSLKTRKKIMNGGNRGIDKSRQDLTLNTLSFL